MFGGETLTTTDLTVRVNKLHNIGDATRVEGISVDVVEKGQNEIYRLLSVGLASMEKLTLLLLMFLFLCFRGLLIG